MRASHKRHLNVVAGGVGSAAHADGGGSMQVGAIALGVAAEGTAGQPAERVVAEGLR